MNEVEETAADEKNAARTDQYAEQVPPLHCRLPAVEDGMLAQIDAPAKIAIRHAARGSGSGRRGRSSARAPASGNTETVTQLTRRRLHFCHACWHRRRRFP